MRPKRISGTTVKKLPLRTGGASEKQLYDVINA